MLIKTNRKTIRITAAVFLLTAMCWLLPARSGGSVFAAPARKSMPVLKLKMLTEFSAPAGASYLEGGTVTSSGYLVTFLSSTTGNPNPILLLNMNSWTTTAAASAVLSHANDMCYIPRTREIYVTPMDRNQFFVLDETTLTLKQPITTPQNYHAVGYDPQTDRFAAIYVSGSGTGRHLFCDILDGSCTTVQRKFSTDTNLTYQGLAVNGSLIYYSCWERGSTSQYEPVYDGAFQKNDNVIYVYDFSGNLVRALLITPPDGYTKFELETVSFSGNRMILQFNETLNDAAGTKKIGIYEVTGEGPSIEQQEAEKKAEEERAAAEKKAAEERAAAEKDLTKLKSVKPKIKSVSRNKTSIKVQWNRVKAGTKKVSGYEIQICRKKSFSGNTLKMYRTSGLKYTLKGLKRKTTYYVRIRAYKRVGGKDYYSKWSAKKNVKTK